MPSGPRVKFEPWSNALFARAKAEHRFVLLDLAAVWCHGCHVMEETTYRDPSVVKLVGDRFIAVRAAGKKSIEIPPADRIPVDKSSDAEEVP